MLTRSSEVYSTLDEAEVEPADAGRRPRAHGAGPLDVRQLWLLLRWRASLIGALVLGAALLAAGALAMLPPKFKATAIVLVDPRQPRVTNSEAVIAGIGNDAAAVESQVEIIESSTLAKNVIARLGLADDPEFASFSIFDRLAEAVGLGADPATLAEKRMSRLENKFQSGLTVRRRGVTYVLEISYVSKDAAKAARIANAVADAYLEDQRAAKAEVTSRASGWLNDRMEEMRARVRESEAAVAAYKSAHDLVDVTQGNKLVSRQIEDLTQQLALTRTRTAEAGARLERVQQVSRQTSDPAALAEALQSPVIAALRSQYAEAARIEAEYSALYGSRYPGLVGVRAQLVDLRRQIDREIGRILDGVRNDYQAAKDREASLEAQLAKLKNEAATLNDADVKLRELEREAQANRTLFEQFLSRAKETSEQQSLQIAEARIISPALVPVKPDRPPAALLVMAAAIGGAVLAIGLILLLEHMRRGLRSPEETEHVLGLPTIGVLPQAATRSGANGRIADARLALDQPASPYAGNLRAARARLRPAGGFLRKDVLAVVSALPGEGKSTFACNLALASAASGVRTLLIDGDAAASTVSRVFGAKGPGLVEVLDRTTTFWDAMTKDAASGLCVLGARDLSTSRPRAEEINGEAFADFLKQHQPHFDLIVIDTPATLSCEAVAPFIEHADRAVLVVEWQRTDRRATIDALDALEPHAHKVVGVVLNKVSPKWCRLFESARYRGYQKYAVGASP